MLKHPKESFHNNFVSLDCDQCTMVTQHGKPMFTQVPAASPFCTGPLGVQARGFGLCWDLYQARAGQGEGVLVCRSSGFPGGVWAGGAGWQRVPAACA